MTMGRLQTLRYQTAKKEFKDQMDPTDLSRSFYVNPDGYVVGFSIVREDGNILEYDAEENKYSCLAKDELSALDIRTEDGIMDLPPFDCHSSEDGQIVYKETHAFPDPSTTSLYESLRHLREGANHTQFSIALAMTSLLRTHLTDNELSILANKAVLMHNNGPDEYPLEEITSHINDLMVNGLADYPVGETHYDSFDGSIVKDALIMCDQDSFNTLLSYCIEESRSVAYTGEGLSPESLENLEEQMIAIIPYLKSAEDNLHESQIEPIDDRIQDAKHRSAAGTKEQIPKEKGPSPIR